MHPTKQQQSYKLDDEYQFLIDDKDRNRFYSIESSHLIDSHFVTMWWETDFNAILIIRHKRGTRGHRGLEYEFLRGKNIDVSFTV